MWNLQRFSRPSCLVRRFSVKTGLHRHGSAKSSRKKKLLVAVCFGAFGLFMRVLALDGNLPPQFRDSDYYTEPAPTPEELASISARLQSVRIGFLASNQKAKKVLGSIAHCANKYRVCIEHIPLAVDEKTHQDFSRNGSSKVNNKDSCRDRNLEDSSSFELPPQQQSHHHQQQQKFDIILHKIPNTGTSRISSQRMLNELQTANPNLLLIDPPSMAIRATDRALHAKLCIAHFNRNLPAKEGSSDKNSSSQHKFGFADSAVLLPSDRMEQVAQAREWVTRNKLTFPLLFKPLTCGEGHDICLVFGPHGLVTGKGEEGSASTGEPRPALIQQYIPHRNQLLYKYRISDKATVELLIQLTDEMRHLLGLQLFNIDAVVEEETGRIFVVDVNYFPG